MTNFPFRGVWQQRSIGWILATGHYPEEVELGRDAVNHDTRPAVPAGWLGAPSDPNASRDDDATTITRSVPGLGNTRRRVSVRLESLKFERERASEVRAAWAEWERSGEFARGRKRTERFYPVNVDDTIARQQAVKPVVPSNLVAIATPIVGIDAVRELLAGNGVERAAHAENINSMTLRRRLSRVRDILRATPVS